MRSILYEQQAIIHFPKTLHLCKFNLNAGNGRNKFLIEPKAIILSAIDSMWVLWKLIAYGMMISILRYLYSSKDIQDLRFSSDFYSSLIFNLELEAMGG